MKQIFESRIVTTVLAPGQEVVPLQAGALEAERGGYLVTAAEILEAVPPGVIEINHQRHIVGAENQVVLQQAVV